MSNNEHLSMVRDLLDYLDDFLTRETSKEWPCEFGNYLAAKGKSEPQPVPLGMVLVAFCNRVRREAARALRDSPFTTIMDYQFLLVLQSHGPMSKSQLIDANGMEISSGTEVINRILSRNWITEAPNPDDRRSKLVRINDPGVAILENHREHLADYYTSVSRPLTPQQQSMLFELIHLLSTGNDK